MIFALVHIGEKDQRNEKESIAIIQKDIYYQTKIRQRKEGFISQGRKRSRKLYSKIVALWQTFS